MRVVLKIGGHLFSRENNLIDFNYLAKISKILRICVKEVSKLLVVVGGGYVARKYIELGRSLGLTESILDLLGIEVARVNAALIYSLTTNSPSPPIPRSLEEAIEKALSTNFLTIGGYQPGQSTTTVAALTAEALPADLLLLTTNVEGIYDSDPKVNPRAKLMREVSVERLEKMFLKEIMAGEYRLLDPLSVKIIKRSKINTLVFSGVDPDNILRAIRGERVGTRILV